VTTMHTLPRWDMSVVYPGLDSSEFNHDFTELAQSIHDLSRLFDEYTIRDHPPEANIETTIHTFETVIERYNAISERVKTIHTYIYCFVTTNSQDTLAQARLSELQQALLPLSHLGTRLTAWIGSLEIEPLIERSELAREHAYILRRARQQAQHLLSPAEEELATELNISGGSAWARLHGNLTSQLMVSVELENGSHEFPMSVVRNMAYEADRELRRRAYEAELDGWQRTALPLAAALNSIKREVSVLARRRHWSSPLDASLFANSIDRQTLDAMISAARASFPDFRRYLRAKARMLGLPRLAWYDLSAPLATDDKVWEFDDATAFIVEQFGTYSSRLSGFAARAFREQWIDAEPRPGKRDGAFCTSLRKDESRVFANFKPTFGGMLTLAHELGHGYHNLNLANRTALQHGHPMTLAETASIFCETITRQGALSNASTHEQTAILEASLQGSCQVVVDITSRFLFEQEVFERRQQRELSITELNNLMLSTQRETYGDGLDEATLHPYMWAVKSHYYSTGRSFYNYPYMFGLLFGLGLYARYLQDPETFKQGYDDLLSATGMADAATLAARFDIDLHTEDFWRSSLHIIRDDIDRFEAIADQQPAVDL
jgi:oligoendopeptidase F